MVFRIIKDDINQISVTEARRSIKNTIYASFGIAMSIIIFILFMFPFVSVDIFGINLTFQSGYELSIGNGLDFLLFSQNTHALNAAKAGIFMQIIFAVCLLVSSLLAYR